mmetsp:Transcript_20193/g.55945  ORF Transcript_20193/g.55945 Transcript_20193/m.55945 type:complete len:256 (-) Transcript_20193:377-1144(-)
MTPWKPRGRAESVPDVRQHRVPIASRSRPVNDGHHDSQLCHAEEARQEAKLRFLEDGQFPHRRRARRPIRTLVLQARKVQSVPLLRVAFQRHRVIGVHLHVAIYHLPLFSGILVEEAIDAILFRRLGGQTGVNHPHVHLARLVDVGPHDRATSAGDELQSELREERFSLVAVWQVVQVDEDSLRPKATVVMLVEHFSRAVSDETQPLQIIHIYTGKLRCAFLYVPYDLCLRRAEHTRARGSHLGLDVFHFVVACR